jgi:GH18 family chitinase
MSKQFISYYADWQFYDRGSLMAPEKIPTDLYKKYTILNYAFFDYNEATRDGSLRGIDDNSSDQILFGPVNWNPAEGEEGISMPAQGGGWTTGHYLGGGILDKMHEVGGKVMASVGGWSYSPGMPQLFSVEATRKKFAIECGKLITECGFDGIDLDWEYPGKSWTDSSISNPKHGFDHIHTNEDAANHLAVLNDIRAELNRIESETDRSGLLVTSCFNANPDACAYDFPGLNQVLDFFNLMTYDLAGSFSAKTNHQTNIYPPTWDDEHIFSVDEAVDAFVGHGIPLEKINIGLAPYGRSMKGATTMNSEFSGEGDNTTGTGGMPMWYEINDKKALWTEHWDDVAKAAWYDNGQSVISCDNAQSSYEKGKYVASKGVAGIIEWEQSSGILSDYSSPLIDSYLSGLNDTREEFTVTAVQPTHGVLTLSRDTVFAGDSVIVTLTPTTGYKVVKFVVNGQDAITTENEYNVQNVQGDVTVSVVLEEDPTIYHAISTSGNNVTFSETNPLVVEGSDIVINYTLDEGYEVINIISVRNGQTTIMGATGTITYTNVTGPITVTVNTQESEEEVIVCEGVQWSVAQTYNGGDFVVYEGKQYRAKWWAESSNIPGEELYGPWQFIKDCSDTGEIIDTQIPVITLVGGDVELVVMDTYVEQGATATDNVSGDITSSITFDVGTIDTTTVGTYVITYDVVDAAGNAAIQATRTVTVISAEEEETGGTCDGVAAWDSATPWTSYSVGDKRVSDGKLYECINTGYAFYDPAGVNGHFGWVFLVTC